MIGSCTNASVLKPTLQVYLQGDVPTEQFAQNLLRLGEEKLQANPPSGRTFCVWQQQPTNLKTACRHFVEKNWL
jgi:hypothetical protein